MAAHKKLSMTQLLAESYKDLVRHVARRFGGLSDAEDVIQDTYFRLQKIPPETDIRNPRSYLFRIADNVAVDHLRSRQARNGRLTVEVPLELPSDEASIERTVDYRQRLKALERAVAELPPRQREVFLMHKFDGLSHSEIAVELGITRSAVEKLIMKSLASLRDRLDGLLD